MYFYKVVSCQLICAFCWVSIRFPSCPRQYGPFHIPENALVGTTVTAVLAGDADVRGGDSWQVDYRLESGNEEEVFTLVTDKQTNEVTLVLSKVNNTNHPATHFLLFRTAHINVKDNFWHGGLCLSLGSVAGCVKTTATCNLSHFYKAVILKSGRACEAQTETVEKNIPIHQYFSPTWVKQKRVQMTMECFRPIISPVPGAHHPSPASFNPAWMCVYVCVRVFVSVFSNGLLSVSGPGRRRSIIFNLSVGVDECDWTVSALLRQSRRCLKAKNGSCINSD